MIDFDKFLLWEAKSRDTIDFKKIYVDIADDLIAGLLLSQLIYWHLPNDKGQSKLRVEKGGYLWIAKGRDDWYEEIRITPKQFDRASNILIDKGIIVKDYFRFNGLRTIHIRLDYDHFMKLWQAQLETPAIDLSVNPQSPKGETRNHPKVKPAIDLSVRPLTESTTKTTSFLAKSSKSQNGSFDRADRTERDNLNVLAEQIATVIQADIDTIGDKAREQLKKLTLALSKKGNIELKLAAFPKWYATNDWRGKQGQPPTIWTLSDTWGQFEAAKSGPPANGNGPTLTDAEKARLAELTAENQTK